MEKFAVKNVSIKTIGFDVEGVQYNLIAGAVQAFSSTLEEQVQAAIAPFGADLVLDYSNALFPKGMYEDFYGPSTQTLSTLIAVINAGDGGRNAIRTGKGQITYFTNIEAQTLVPVIVADGLNIGCDQTNGDGLGLDWGLETVRSVSTFTAHSDAVYFKHKVTIDTVTGANLIMGLRKAEAFQKDFNDYDEMVGLQLKAGTLYTDYILNNGATVETSTTNTIANGDVVDLYVAHDQATAIANACTLANNVKAMLNLHLISSAAHITSIDTTNTITAADATTVTTLVTLVNQMITKYGLHEDDAALAAAWVYHVAQETGSHALASTVPVVGLRTAVAMLKDMKTKINAHINDITTHGVADTNISASSVITCAFFMYAVNGGALTVPTVVPEFMFDVAEKIVPFVQYKHTAALAGKVVVAGIDFNLI